jgi:hypothetical protein
VMRVNKSQIIVQMYTYDTAWLPLAGSSCVGPIAGGEHAKTRIGINRIGSAFKGMKSRHLPQVLTSANGAMVVTYT